MSAHLRVYFVLASLLSPTFVPSQDAEHDWVPQILAPSEWDWCPQCAFVPNLGRHPLPKASRGE